jgi:hypothetical protein
MGEAHCPKTASTCTMEAPGWRGWERGSGRAREESGQTGRPPSTPFAARAKTRRTTSEAEPVSEDLQVGLPARNKKGSGLVLCAHLQPVRPSLGRRG